MTHTEQHKEMLFFSVGYCWLVMFVSGFVCICFCGGGFFLKLKEHKHGFALQTFPLSDNLVAITAGVGG